MSLKRLNGYEDLNFHIKVNQTEYDNTWIDSPSENGYVIKIINSRDSSLYKQRSGRLFILSAKTCLFYI